MLKLILKQRKLMFNVYYKNKVKAYFNFLKSYIGKINLQAFCINASMNLGIIFLLHFPISPLPWAHYPETILDYTLLTFNSAVIVFGFVMNIVMPYRTFSKHFNAGFVEILVDFIKNQKGEMTDEEYARKHL